MAKKKKIFCSLALRNTPSDQISSSLTKFGTVRKQLETRDRNEEKWEMKYQYKTNSHVCCFSKRKDNRSLYTLS